ncbi:ATP-binding cassette domain-containing protein [Corynebacterium poyangense]|uniref:ATP-binding cassette domain-containing protein n=1 Tax=Corynebacterium poyangense TaxID=2684405 RepID=A0A7H0SPI2_9CORY|nr:ABC transporter ATP-binding protein [Corynebacterium poyangense]MBZ8178040.1 ATP-binding cassette domain-containing protein [Corynebacterium poyangense]QNQ90457.1 ATP-binding cassette domain-containing protein [Corynebacterium poyangense]
MMSLDPNPRNAAIALRGLNKRFGDKIAVDNLSLDIPRGCLCGIVGPNGAGKTTTISLATGLLKPDSGEAYIAGYNTWLEPEKVKKQMGLLADNNPYFERLSGPELLAYAGGLRGMEPDVIAQRGSELLETLGLAEAADTRVVDYSAGMTKKILLAVAMLHNPEVLILDEPLESVDPVSARLIQDILKSYVHHGGTVVLSSHVMELVEGLCDHVTIINQGRVLHSAKVSEIRGNRSLSEVFVELVGGAELDEGSLAWLGGPQNEEN